MGKKNNIPETWIDVVLTDVAYIEDHLRKPINSADRQSRIEGKLKSSLFPYYGATGQVGLIDSYLTDGDYILIGEDGAPFFDAFRNKAYEIKGKTWVNNHAHILKANKFFNQKYLLHYLNQFDYKDYVSGTTRLKLTKGSLERFPLPLPPLNEQHRIVSKIEELFSELDNGVANLKLAQNQLKIYRQALLKHAFEGKLTKQWRKENNPEPAEKLLDRIKEERQQRYEQELKEWKAAVKAWEKHGKNGKKPGKPKLPRIISQIPGEKTALLSKLPKGWKWTQSGNLFLYVTSGSRGWANFYSESGSIFIRITNLNFDTLDLDLSPDKTQFVLPPDNTEGIRTKVKEGDFLFSITGYLGMFAIAPKVSDAYVNQHVALARPSKLNNLIFLGYWIIAKSGGFYFLNEKNKGAVKAGLNLNDILEFPIPICSVEEQNILANRLESQFSIIHNLEQTIESGLQKSEALRQSILKKAFEGKLVPQDPNDEPASELLKRIQAEKKKYLEEQNQQKKRKPNNTKKMSKELSIEEVLKASAKPMLAKEVWQKSKHKANIEDFYKELKDIQSKIKEVKRGTESLLSLSK